MCYASKVDLIWWWQATTQLPCSGTTGPSDYRQLKWHVVQNATTLPAFDSWENLNSTTGEFCSSSTCWTHKNMDQALETHVLIPQHLLVIMQDMLVEKVRCAAARVNTDCMAVVSKCPIQCLKCHTALYVGGGSSLWLRVKWSVSS